MSEHDEVPETEPSADSDAVAGFFAQARSQVHDEPATDLDWQRIVGESRRVSRRRSRLTLLTSAAVAVIAIVAVLMWQQNAITGGVKQGQAIEGSDAVLRTGPTASTTSSVSEQQSPTKVPDSFRTWSVSNAGQSTLYALGSQDCGTDKCPVLVRSTNNGDDWVAVHTFTGTDVSAATSDNDVPQIQPERAITQVRFATPQTGFVFGGDLWVTHDSGATFTKLNHPGARVLDVEFNRGQAVMLSADNCAQGECKGAVHVTRFDPSAEKITQAQAQMTPKTPITGGNLVVQNGSAYVQLTSADDASSLAPMRLDGSDLVALKSPAACNNTQLQSITAATNIKSLELFAICNPVQQSGDKLSYTLVRSSDGGSTWHSVSIGALSLPNLGRVWLAVADTDHIAASAGGPRDTQGVPATSGAGSLMWSTNGGTGFGPASPPDGASIPKTGFDWLASPGAKDLYAITRTTHGFWKTSDFGSRWTVVDPRG